MVMAKIHKIDEYEKIAAGEVIERPAAVAKELLENAIDAGATRIEMHVEEAGTRSIKVIDDGAGIEPDEAVLAFERHTTSKIMTFSDVYNLSTLGFRGEALASIKAVARVEMVTRTERHEMGKRVVLEGDQLLEDGPVACPVGTTVVVKKLFFNVPVRRKFLKNDAVEFSHISDIVTRYALAYHDLSIKLFHDGHLVLDAPPSKGDLLNKIVSVYGREHAASMIAIDQKAPDFSLHGYVAAPDITRSARTYSTLLVNRRYVHSADVARAIESAYEARLMKGRYPFYVLFLDIKPSLIDVNIHPTKREIKFSNEDELLSKVEEWARAALDCRARQGGTGAVEGSLDDHLAPAGAAAPGGQERTYPASRNGSRGARPRSFDEVLDEASERIPERILDVDEDFSRELEGGHHGPGVDGDGTDSAAGATVSQTKAAPGRASKLSGWRPLDVGTNEEGLENIDSGAFKVLPPVKLLSKGIQLGNTYLFFETSDGSLAIVDQHAASERVEYERIARKYKASSIPSQRMLIPKALSLPPNLLALVDASQPALKRLGFEILKDATGSVPSYKVVQFPLVFHVNVDFRVIEDFLTALLSMDRLDAEDDVVKLLACHSAIRAGDPLDRRQVWALLSDLDKCDDPLHCCHGRPTFIVKEAAWLEKEFKRVT
ncbi:MAG: DNA mismatch repair endonuclease MutL [Candidatus Lokiarchaeota archaeon]|nr:DNA mismatch repair endonuclease MutL [Candidatus Lokiarchaeota archaeon]